jgi:demethylmenaquinone methyltransferase/2-methoxy-6-polyprenyl-1,4-benzoquinol methylase
MFGQVAPRYDLLNHLLSFNIDKRWRRIAVERVRDVLMNPQSRVLDLCCGTGDLMLALAEGGRARALGSDFCHPMLVEARRKASDAAQAGPVFEADALQLPVRDASLDLITIAFGFRNLANYRSGLLELRRVLRPGGVLAILEFSQPPNPAFARLYNWYSRYVLPKVGAAVSGAPQAYTYLPQSVSKFPGPEELAGMMSDCGFAQVSFERLTFGIVALHIGRME